MTRRVSKFSLYAIGLSSMCCKIRSANSVSSIYLSTVCSRCLKFTRWSDLFVQNPCKKNFWMLSVEHDVLLCSVFDLINFVEKSIGFERDVLFNRRKQRKVEKNFIEKNRGKIFV